MNMTHGTNGGKTGEEGPPPRPPSQQSSSSSGGSKHVKCIGRYVLTGHTLGKGNFARVEAAVHTLTRAKVAIKIIETDKIKEDYVRKNLLREAQLMRRLHHPNIIRLYETMKTNNLYCLVTEIADGGELLSHVRNDFKERRLTEATTRPFIRQLVSALHHLHSTGIVHRDLKMENILLDKKKRNIKIVDFGLSNSTKPGSLLQTHCGSPEYAAPELFIPGREYGPEVDVWSLGVNLYAMLVGKLPFRSPRQGTKRRQKLLEQISNGISEYHEKEMAHVSGGARDLIGRLLQPDPRRRAQLNEVMQHPWVTKNGEHPLIPYQEQPVDQSTKASVISIMSSVLEVSASEIKEAVKRDRCDWLAAVFNLLIDQPEGRNIIQQLISGDPEDQLVDAVHYQGSMEHFRLSQAESIDTSPRGATVNGLGPVQRSHRHSVPDNEYASSTLPSTKWERRHHQTQEPRPLGQPRVLNPLQYPLPLSLKARRASIASPFSSPEHQAPYQPNRDPILSHYYHQQSEKKRHSSRGGRRLPSTPVDETYHKPVPEAPRAHSRADSMPDPLPPPWRHNIAPITQLTKPAVSPLPDSIPMSKSPLMNDGQQNLCEQVSPMAHLKPNKRNLKPIRPKSHSLGSKSLSRSVDANLHIKTNDQHTKSVMWPPQVQVGPFMSPNGKLPINIGWSSSNNIHKKALPGKLGRDIQGLMDEKPATPSSAYNSIRDLPQEMKQLEGSGSIVSVDIQHDLFKPQYNDMPPDIPKPSHHRQSHPHLICEESLKVDSISGEEKTRHRALPRQPYARTVSAKQPPKGYIGHKQEITLSARHISSDKIHHLSNGDSEQETSIKSVGQKSSTGGILEKAFKLKSSRERSGNSSLHPQPT